MTVEDLASARRLVAELLEAADALEVASAKYIDAQTSLVNRSSERYLDARYKYREALDRHNRARVRARAFAWCDR